jgi:catechol 2,3-dioxygenase-like lactoylglutathione lyase family enzyme
VSDDAERAQARELTRTLGPERLAAGDTLEVVSPRELNSAQSHDLGALVSAGRLPATLVNGHVALSDRLPTAEELLRSLRDRVTPHRNKGAALSWPTSRRVHINIDVADVAQSLAFYEVLLGQEATKVREDYAKFEVANPPINLALNQVGHATATGVNHMGIEVQASDDVLSSRERYRRSGFQLTEELEVVCCYAEQNKIWVADPDGNRWEVVNVVGDVEAEEACPPDCICHQEIPPSVVETRTQTVG